MLLSGLGFAWFSSDDHVVMHVVSNKKPKLGLTESFLESSGVETKVSYLKSLDPLK